MTRRLVPQIGTALVLAAVVACSTSEVVPVDSAEAALAHLKTFESHDNPVDDPGSDGERAAMEYARSYLEQLGLSASIQTVPLVRMVPTTFAATITGPDNITMDAGPNGERFIVWAGQQSERLTVKAELVFAGYGIVAPEYHRDDYKTMDVRGKVVVLLEGVPQVGERDALGTLGHTYYGTRLYKFAEAARRGAAGALMIHSDPSVAWTTIQATSADGVVEIDATVTDQDRYPKAPLEGWLSAPAAATLFKTAAADQTALVHLATDIAFTPTPLPGLTLTVDITNRIVRSQLHNVVAVLEGQTPEYVLVAGRWNRFDPEGWSHLRVASGEAASASPLADDDGSGAAIVMDVARRIREGEGRPLRSIVFMVATAVKSGIFGIEYFMEHPPEQLPVEQLTALLFLDHGDLSGLSKRIGKIGIDADEALSQMARQAAIEQGRLFELDEHKDKRFYYTFGQTELGRDGVRTLYLTTRPADDGSGRLLRDQARRDIVLGLPPQPHLLTPAPWQDAALLTTITSRVANATNWPPRIEPAAIKR